jgi:hypothetical protein
LTHRSHTNLSQTYKTSFQFLPLIAGLKFINSNWAKKSLFMCGFLGPYNNVSALCRFFFICNIVKNAAARSVVIKALLNCRTQQVKLQYISTRVVTHQAVDWFGKIDLLALLRLVRPSEAKAALRNHFPHPTILIKSFNISLTT